MVPHRMRAVEPTSRCAVVSSIARRELLSRQAKAGAGEQADVSTQFGESIQEVQTEFGQKGDANGNLVVQTSAHCQIVERRAQERHTLILRIGVLEQAGKVSLRLMKNISSKGMQLRFFPAAMSDVSASIRVADEPRLDGQLGWLNNDMAGITFEITPCRNLAASAAKAAPDAPPGDAADRRGGLREIAVGRPRVPGDRSRHFQTRSAAAHAGAAGAGGSRHSFAPWLRPIYAFVRWSDGDESGVAFDAPIPTQTIAHWMDALERLRALPES